MTSVAYRLDRRAALRGAAGFALLGPLLVPIGRRPHAQTLDKVSIQTDWRAQTEHGGYYQAIATGLYRKAGIECDVHDRGDRAGRHTRRGRRHRGGRAPSQRAASPA